MDIDAGPAERNSTRQGVTEVASCLLSRQAPCSSSLPPCSRLSRRGLETPERGFRPARRPALTASARVGAGHLRSGRKKACGAVEQKKTPKQERKRLGVLRSWRAIRLGTKRGAVWKGLDKVPLI